MFSAESWAHAFIGAAANAGGEGFALLQAIVPVIQTIPGQVSGTAAAKHLEPMLRKACGNTADSNSAAETAICFLLLVIKRGRFRYMDSILKEIENLLAEKNGILTVTLETAAPAGSAYEDPAFTESLKAQLQKKSGASEIKIKTRIVPELLGGYRLRMGNGDCIDASLSLFLKEMAADIAGADNAGTDNAGTDISGDISGINKTASSGGV
jgi:F-type H+-transporting ATPase subunit delta